MKFPDAFQNQGGGQPAQDIQPMRRIQRADDGSFRFTDYRPQQGGAMFGDGSDGNIGNILRMVNTIAPGAFGGSGSFDLNMGQQPQQSPEGRIRLAQMLVNQGGGR